MAKSKSQLKSKSTPAVAEKSITKKPDARIKALVSIAEENNGVLRAEDVVNEARDPNNVLHGAFEWDNTKAAHEFRLAQARYLIRTAVQYLPESPREDVRVFVSLPSDQQKEGGGYRLLSRVITDAEMYKELLDNALDDYDLFRKKYERIRELRPLFREGDRIKKAVHATAGKATKA